MKQYIIIEENLIRLLSGYLKLDIVSKMCNIADFNSIKRPETITENQYNLMKTGIDLYNTLLDIVKAIKHGNNISSDIIENAITILEKSNVMSKESLIPIIRDIEK